MRSAYRIRIRAFSRIASVLGAPRRAGKCGESNPCVSNLNAEGLPGPAGDALLLPIGHRSLQGFRDRFGIIRLFLARSIHEYTYVK
jgi:hypothetical protein